MNIGDVYIQAASYSGDQVLIEISAERFMPAERALPPGSHKRLMDLGLRRPTQAWPNWWIAMEDSPDDGLLDAARATTIALLMIYRVPVADIAESLGLPTVSGEEPADSPRVTVQPRAEDRADGSRFNLWASLDDDGNLHLTARTSAR